MRLQNVLSVWSSLNLTILTFIPAHADIRYDGKFIDIEQFLKCHLFKICRFCWNKLRTEGNGLCPACRTPYTENPADFKPLTSEEMAKIKVIIKMILG